MLQLGLLNSSGLWLHPVVAQDIEPSTASSADDFTLLDAIAAGDAAAMETFYNRYSAIVYALCARIVGDRMEAEDVLIDVFSQIWTRRAQFDAARGAPLTYLLTIARSRALDHRRSSRRGRAALAPLDDPARAVAAVATGAASDAPDGRLLAEEDAHGVRAALAQLDESHRRAIELSFFDGLSHSQIAEKLRQPLGTIKTMIRQGLIQLRKRVCTREQGGPPPP